MTAEREAQGRGRTQRGKATSPNTIAVRRKQQQAVELKAQGWTLQHIADKLGYANTSGAYKAIEAVMDRSESESAGVLREVHGERIRMAYEQIGPIMQGRLVLPEMPPDGYDREFVGKVADAVRADYELRLKASDRWNRTMEREAKLHGLDAPSRSEVSGDGQVLQVVFDSALAPKPLPAIESSI
ncbi:MAG: hypothetical protein ACR2P2_15440 [Nakamurella sp.]